MFAYKAVDAGIVGIHAAGSVSLVKSLANLVAKKLAARLIVAILATINAILVVRSVVSTIAVKLAKEYLSKHVPVMGACFFYAKITFEEPRESKVRSLS